MDDTTNTWLAIIAVSTLVIALIQVGAIIGAAVAARRIQGRVATLEKRVEQQVHPLLERMNVVSADLSRISALAVQQAEKADVALTSAASRVDQTLAVVQNAVVTPAREGMAVAAALKAAVGSIRKGTRRKSSGDEDDPLFIG